MLVKLRQSSNRSELTLTADQWVSRLGFSGAALQRMEAPQLSANNNAPLKTDRPLILHLNGHTTVEDALRLLKQHPDVEIAEPDYLGHATGAPNDPYYYLEWHHQKIESEAAWNVTTGSASVIVAMLDSGINASLSEFAGRLLPGYDYANSDSNPADDYGHGTAMTGTVAANANNNTLVAGMNWNCKIMPEKILRSDGFGYYSWWAQATYAATDAGAKVINLSAGGDQESQTLTDAIDYAIAHNVIFVASAGNESTGPVVFPGRLPQCICVGATERDDSHASFSNFGTNLDLVAPGRDIYTVGRTGVLEYWYGSSPATALVSGVAALVAALKPSINQAGMEKLLEESADDRVGGIGDTAGWDQYFGYGRLNAKNAVQLAAVSANPGTLSNISTRLQIGIDDNVLIAGIVITGTQPKKVLIRGLGPTLSQFNVPNVLVDPQLELHDSSSVIGTNDDWQTTQLGGVISADQKTEIENSQFAPPNSSEPAIIATLAPGSYTAILRGANSTTGAGLVEAYDISGGTPSQLANISTRGFVQTGDGVMIGGLVTVNRPTRVLVRALGPTLAQFGLNNVLANPQLELHDATGIIATNDDWQTTQVGGSIARPQVSAIQASGLAPPNGSESAITTILQPGSYTAIVRGAGDTTGIALVEVYNLDAN